MGGMNPQAEMIPSQQKEEIFHITLLRHGESEGNLNGYIQGQRDLPLTQKGLEQAQSISNAWLLSKTTFDLIISSPLRRTRMTAELIGKNLEVPIEFDVNLIERGFGQMEGREIKKILVENPPDFNQPYIKPGVDGESLVEVFNRAGMFLQNLLCRPAGRYLVVSHGAFLNMLVYVIFGITPHNNPRTLRFNFSNTGYASFSFNPSIHQWRLLEFITNHYSKEPNIYP